MKFIDVTSFLTSVQKQQSLVQSFMLQTKRQISFGSMNSQLNFICGSTKKYAIIPAPSWVKYEIEIPKKYGNILKQLINNLTIYIHTYITDNYNFSVRITAQLLTPLILCELILYVSGGTYSLRTNFHRNFIFTLRVLARNLLREIFIHFVA